MISKNTLQKLRMIFSFALLGAVMAGSIFGFGESHADFARNLGAFSGGLVGVLKTMNLF